MSERFIEVAITIDTSRIEAALVAARVQVEATLMKMIPVVVLIEERDLERLNRIVAPIEAEIEDNERAKQICADHGWSPSMLAWSRVLHSAANSLDLVQPTDG